MTADAALQNTRASLPPLRAQRDGALFRLAALTGKTPAEADAAVKACAQVPRLTSAIPVGDGAGLIARQVHCLAVANNFFTVLWQVRQFA